MLNQRSNNHEVQVPRNARGVMAGCGDKTLPKPNTAKTAGVEALVAYGLAAHVANQYLALPTCTKPITATPCKSDDIAARVKAADLAAYNAAIAADKAANDPLAQSNATATLESLKSANAQANGGNAQ
jgi:hypothetical protein